MSRKESPRTGFRHWQRSQASSLRAALAGWAGA